MTAIVQPCAAAEVALHRIDVAARLAAEDAGAMARLAQERDHMSPQRSGPAGDEDVHFLPSCSPKKVTTRRHTSSAASWLKARPDSLKNEWPVSG